MDTFQALWEDEGGFSVDEMTRLQLEKLWLTTLKAPWEIYSIRVYYKYGGRTVAKSYYKYMTPSSSSTPSISKPKSSRKSSTSSKSRSNSPGAARSSSRARPK